MSRLLNLTKWFFRVIQQAAYKFYFDDCFSRASALAYTTLFALVPVSALSFSIFSAFKIDKAQVSKTIMAVLEQVLPPIENDQLKKLHEEVFSYLTSFSENVSALNIISVAVLFFTAVALLNTIESALNVVWRVSTNIGIVSKLIIFWAVMTLGPLFLSISFFGYAKFNNLAMDYPFLETNYYSLLGFIVPLLSIWLALTLLYFKLPGAKVRIHDAAFGGFIAAILFEIVKRSFASYIGMSSTYQTVYGFLTTIPIFLFWIYITWVIILYGAEISYQVGSIKLLFILKKYISNLGDIGWILGLRVLQCIVKNFKNGNQPPTEGEISEITGVDPVKLRLCLNILTDTGILTISDSSNHCRSLLLAPDKIKFVQIMNAFRSKKHQIEFNGSNVNSEHEDFMESIRKVALHTDPNITIEDWTLDLLANY